MVFKYRQAITAVMFFYPFFFFLLLLAPSVFVMQGSSDSVSVLVFEVLLLGAFVFLFCSSVVFFGLARASCVRDGPFTSKCMMLLFLIFIFSYIILVCSYGGFPVIEYLLHGGSPNQLRSDFYKDKHGVTQIAVYVRSILMKGFIPVYAVYAYLFYSKKKFLLVFGVYFLFSLMTFEKAAVLWFVLPLMVLFLYNKKYKILTLCVALSVLSISLLGGLQQSQHKGVEDSASSGFRSEFDIKASLYDVDTYQFFFSDIEKKKAFPFLLDRVFWIPFVTVYDTFYYWSVNYNDILMFSTNRHLAKITGSPFANIEREVFIFQYGGGEATTGNANASYVAEAYLMFGFLGVILFSAFFGVIHGAVLATGNELLISAFAVYPFAVITSASLLSMMFSGGLLLYLLLAHFLTVRYKL